MARLLLTTLLLGLFALPAPDAQAGTFLSRQLRAPRVKAALRTHGAEVREDFRAAGAAWPPRGLFLRSFKREKTLEVWAGAASGDALVRVWSLPLCAQSGGLGPKRFEGDFQTPEGFYSVDRFNPWSRFHLSLGIDYPNALDRARAGDDSAGSDIFVHGGCATIGCLPVEDGPMARLYLAVVMARDRGQRHLPVHLFPCRFGEARCEAALADAASDDPSLTYFWVGLRAGYRAFERSRTVPRLRVNALGYQLR